MSAATCQLTTRMQTRTEHDWERLKRVCRNLRGRLGFKHVCRWTAKEEVKLWLLTDSDRANEARSRKSHSGGDLLADAIFFNIGADVNRWWRSPLAKQRSTVACAFWPGSSACRTFSRK